MHGGKRRGGRGNPGFRIAELLPATFRPLRHSPETPVEIQVLSSAFPRPTASSALTTCNKKRWRLRATPGSHGQRCDEREFGYADDSLERPWGSQGSGEVRPEMTATSAGSFDAHPAAAGLLEVEPPSGNASIAHAHDHRAADVDGAAIAACPAPTPLTPLLHRLGRLA
jgi:hypothetical protein